METTYWLTRNALVDAVLAAGKRAPSCVTDDAGFTAWLGTSEGDAYCAALAELKAFDRVHGGAPIL